MYIIEYKFGALKFEMMFQIWQFVQHIAYRLTKIYPEYFQILYTIFKHYHWMLSCNKLSEILSGLTELISDHPDMAFPFPGVSNHISKSPEDLFLFYNVKYLSWNKNQVSSQKNKYLINIKYTLYLHYDTFI